MSINYVLFRIELWANISVQKSKNFGGKNQMAPDVWGRQLFFENKYKFYFWTELVEWA